MNAPLVRRAAEVFRDAVELPALQRRVFVEARCNGDPSLLALVRGLLKADDDASGGPLDAPLFDERASPGRIGSYELIRVIGEGGMAVVYEARQDNPRRTVAIKLLRCGALSPELMRRFEHEAHVLGQLQHPGIAHIYEAGVAPPQAPGVRTGQPYYVMELIRGKPLTVFAREHALDIPARLELVARVCDAVQYAHQRGVIHRDLKPANILVAGGTPARGDDGADDHGWGEADADRVRVDSSASDLAASTSRGSQEPNLPRLPATIPAESSSFNLGESALTPSVRPAAPSPLAPSAPLPKILDFGVARVTGPHIQGPTMNTEAGRLIGTLAYMSPEQLAGDVDATDTRSDVYALGVILYELLAGRLPHELRELPLHEAVRRVRETEPVRVGAIDRRCRGEIETVVARALEKDRERRYGSAAELATDLRRLLRGEPILARADSALYMLRKRVRRHRGLAAAAGVFVLGLGVFAGYAWTQAARFEKLSQDERAARVAASTEADKAQRVSAFLSGVFELARPDPQRGYNLTLTDVLDDATQRLDAGALADHPEVEAVVRETLADTYNNIELCDAVAAHAEWLVQHHRAASGPISTPHLDALFRLAHAYGEGGRQRLAQPRLKQAIEIARRLDGGESARVYWLMDTLANSYMRNSELAAAMKCSEEASAGLARVCGPESGEAAQAYFNLAFVYSVAGRLAEAEDYFRRAIAIKDAVDPGSITTVRCRWSFARACLREPGRWEQAEALLRETVALATSSLGADHAETHLAQRGLAVALMDQGRADEALPRLRAALDHYRTPRRWTQVREGGVARDLAACLTALGCADEAVAELRASIARLEDRFGRAHPMILDILEDVVTIERDRGRHAEAEGAAAELLERVDNAGPADGPPPSERRARVERLLAQQPAGDRP